MKTIKIEIDGRKIEIELQDGLELSVAPDGKINVTSAQRSIWINAPYVSPIYPSYPYYSSPLSQATCIAPQQGQAEAYPEFTSGFVAVSNTSPLPIRETQ